LDVPLRVGGIGRVSGLTRIWQVQRSFRRLIKGVGVAQSVRGIQDAGVIATAKHYIGNEQVYPEMLF
jgi:hypothetical protein